MKGIASFILIFTIIFIFLILVFTLIIPFNIKIQSETYKIGKELLENSRTGNEEIDTSLNNTIQAIPANVEILSLFLRYSWVVITLVIVIILFIFSRRIVEYKVS